MLLDVDLFPDRPGGELDFRGRKVWYVSAPDGKRVVEVTVAARAAKAFERHLSKDEAPATAGAPGVESTGCSPPAPSSTEENALLSKRPQEAEVETSTPCSRHGVVHCTECILYGHNMHVR